MTRWSDEWRDDCEFDELRIEDVRRRRGELVDESGEEAVEDEVDEGPTE